VIYNLRKRENRRKLRNKTPRRSHRWQKDRKESQQLKMLINRRIPMKSPR